MHLVLFREDSKEKKTRKVEFYYLIYANSLIFFFNVLTVHHLQMKQKMQKEAELLKRRSMDVEKQLLQFQQNNKQEKVFMTIIFVENRIIAICCVQINQKYIYCFTNYR